MTDYKNKNITNSKNNNSLKIFFAIIIIILAMIIIYFVTTKNKETEQPVAAEQAITKEMPEQQEVKVEPKPTIDYNELEKNEDLKKAMEERKKKYDIKNSLDMIVGSNETFKIKNYEISMEQILKQAALKRGDVVEETIGKSGVAKDIKQYGIYVVSPGDNIWNIHFNILREYYSLKNVSVGKKVDEPDAKGFSSGVGKILKFSETQVIIYNLEKGTIDTDINIIEPLTKIIIYNMYETFSLLDEINFENVDRLQFDGRTIWISTDK